MIMCTGKLLSNTKEQAMDTHKKWMNLHIIMLSKKERKKKQHQAKGTRTV